MELGTLRIALTLLVCLSFSVQGADKYTDENRPYEFGFTIDGQQHRHEKKDKDGIIMGEFGFVTADDVYHVTVYATDKEGRFKILSMKNIHLKSSKVGLGTTPARQGHSLALPPATSSAATLSPPAPQSAPKTVYKSVSIEPPARSCSSCSLPTTTTRAPPPAPPSSPNQFGLPNYGSQRPSSVSQSQGAGEQQNSFVSNAQQGVSNSEGSFGSSQPNQNYPVSQNGFIGTPNNAAGLTQKGFGNAGNGGSEGPQPGLGAQNIQPGSQSPYPEEGSRGQFGPGESGLQPPYLQIGPQKTSYSQRGPGSQSYPQGEEQLAYPQGGSTVQSSNPQIGSVSQDSHPVPGSGPQSAYPQNENGPGSQGSHPVLGSRPQSAYPQNENGPGSQDSHPVLGSRPQSAYPQNENGPGSQGSYPVPGSRPQSAYSQNENRPGYQGSHPVPGSRPQSAYLQNENGPGSQGSHPIPGSRPQSAYPQNEYGLGSQGSYPVQGSGPQSAYPQNKNSPTTYAQGGPSSSSYPSQGSEQSSYPQGGNNAQGQSSSVNRPNDGKSPTGSGEPGIRTSKKYDGSPQQYNPNTGSKKPTLISAQMQIVDKNTDIHSLRPGESKGLPPGLNQDDMTQLLYTFNYTVGFHGHFEEGFTSGVKRGYYYVTGRNGVKTRIDYTADSTGFHPKVSQEVLDLLSEDVPKPETEKDAKYGLKGYEFKWLYYPVGSKR